jgi:hypothetical protein
MVFLAELSLDSNLHRTQASSLCLVWIERVKSSQFCICRRCQRDLSDHDGYNHPGLPLSQPVYEIEACTGGYRILAERLYNMVRSHSSLGGMTLKEFLAIDIGLKLTLVLTKR